MKNLLLIVLLAAVLFTAGCTGGNKEPVVTPTLNVIHVSLSQTPAATTAPQTVYGTFTVTPVPTTPVTTVPEQGSSQTYTSSEFGFSIQFPKCWTASREDLSSEAFGKKYMIVLTDPTLSSKQDISITPGSSGLSLDHWANVFVSQVKNDPSVGVVGQYPMDLDGVPAKKTVLTYGSGSDATQSMIIMAIKGDNAYYMEFTSRRTDYPTYSEDADTMLKTFKFL